MAYLFIIVGCSFSAVVYHDGGEKGVSALVLLCTLEAVYSPGRCAIYISQQLSGSLRRVGRWP